MKRAALYFLAGAGLDFLITFYYLAVDSRALFSASVLSALITVWSICFINGIVNERNDSKRKSGLILAYALGNGAGTAVAMMIR